MGSGAQDGSIEAVFREHYAFVWRTACRYGVEPSAADDVVQDVFLVVHRKLSDFDGAVAIRTWIFAIARHVIRAHVRKRRTRDRKVDALETSVAGSAGAPPLDAAVVLQQMLARLSESKRDIYIMIELEGMTAAEVGKVTGLNPNTVSTRLRAARATMERLAQTIERQGRGEPRGKRRAG